MDAQDIRIFCALAISGPPEAIVDTNPRGVRRAASSLGLDEKTVRVRLRRLERGGFIKYYQATPDLALLGMGAEVTCRFDAVNIPTKVAALQFVPSVPGMVEALDFLGTTFVVTVAGPTREAALESHRQIRHRFELDRLEVGRTDLPASDARLLPLDWRILERMRYDGRAPPAEVAATLGITQRVIRYRLGRMRAAGAFRVRPILDARRLRGVIVYRLAVHCLPEHRGDVLGRLRRLMGEQIWAARISLAGPLLIDMFGTTLAEPEESAVRVLDVPGVEACSVLTLKEIVEPQRGGWIDRGMAELASDRRPAAPTRAAA